MMLNERSLWKSSLNGNGCSAFEKKEFGRKQRNESLSGSASEFPIVYPRRDISVALLSNDDMVVYSCCFKCATKIFHAFLNRSDNFHKITEKHIPIIATISIKCL